MSDHDPIAAVLDMFPEVAEAADKYKIAEPDRESRGLTRGIANEQALFGQTQQRLQLSAHSAYLQNDRLSMQRLEAEFGVDVAARIVRDLEILTNQLQTLRVDLINASRGKEVLDKIRAKVPGPTRGRDKNSKTRLQLRLDVVSKTNQILASRLLQQRTVLSEVYQAPNATRIRHSLAEISNRAQQDFIQLKENCKCRCNEPHIVLLRFPDILAGNSAQRLTVTTQPRGTNGTICCFDAMSLEQESCSNLPFQEWIRLQRSNLGWKRRIELALQLSVAVIGLTPTFWIEGSWTWDDWAITSDHASHRSGVSLIFCRQFGTSSPTRISRPQTSTTWSILSHEPTIARLGLCLIELAFGQTLSEMRRDENDKTDVDVVDELDPESLDFLMAKRLITTQRIRYQFGKLFESAVKACINQQFRAEKGGAVPELGRGQSFFDNASKSIILPLQLQIERYLRAERRETPLAKEAYNKAVLERLPAFKKEFLSKNHREFEEPATPHVPLQHQEEHTIDELGSCDTQLSKSIVSQSKEGATESRYRLRSTDEDSKLPPRTPAEESIAIDKVSNILPLVRSGRIGQTRGREQNVAIRHDNDGSMLRPPSPTAQSQQESEWAYGSLTETTDSAQAWAVDALDEPPGKTSHPFLSRVKHLILAVVLHNFHTGNERNPGSVQSTSGPAMEQQGGRAKKRTRKQVGRSGAPSNNGNEDGEEDDDDNEEPGNKKRLRAHKKTVNKTLACPFFLKDRRTYASCCGRTLSRIRDVKQHLKRRHYIPIYCSLCYQQFQDEDARDDHTAERNCEKGDRKRPEGINQRQQAELGARASRQLSEEQQWFEIFRLVFPNESVPSSAYIDATLFETATAYKSFVTSKGPEILQRFLEKSGLVNWNVPDEEFQRQILADGLADISNSWTNGEVASPSAERMPGKPERLQAQFTAPSEFGSVEMVTAGSTSLGPDLESSSSAFRTDPLPSIADSSEYTHSNSEQWWPQENFSYRQELPPDLRMGEALGDTGMREMEMIISEFNFADSSLNWQQHGRHTGHYTDQR